MSFLRYFKGASSVSFASLISVALIFATQVVLSRFLEPQEFGDFISCVAILTVFSTFSTLGSDLSLLKKFGISNKAGREYGVSVAKYSLMTSGISCLLMIIFFYFTSSSNLQYKLMLLPSIIAFAIWSVVNVVYQVQHRYSVLALYQVLPAFLRLSLIILIFYLYEYLDLGYVISSYLAYNIAALILILFCAKTFYQLISGTNFDSEEIISHNVSYRTVFIDSLPYSIAAVSFAIYAQNGLYSVNKYVGSHESAAYGIALSFIFAIYVVPGVIYQKIILPKFHQWSNYNKPILLKMLQLGNGTMLLLGILFCLGTLLFSNVFVGLFFGEKYLEAIKILHILAFALPFRFMISNLGALLSTGKNVKYKIFAMILIVVACTILNIYIAQFFGAKGVAYFFVISEIVMFLAFMFIAQLKIYGVAVWLGWFKFRGEIK